MGNNSSRSEIITETLTHAENQLKNSNLKQHHYLQHKVLPEKNTDTKLRPTNNGEIIHNGGSLSKKSNIIINTGGRKDFEMCRSNSVSSHSSEKYNKVNKQKLLYSYHEEMDNFQMKHDKHKNDKKNSHIICSATDLRERYKNRKKYRAPSPPLNLPLNKEKVGEKSTDSSEKSAIRKSRLFKTQAEIKIKKSSPLSTEENTKTKANAFENKFKKMAKPPLPNLQRTRSMPELQAEIQEIKERIKQLKKRELEVDNNNYGKTKTAERNFTQRNAINRKNNLNPTNAKPAPKKTFYFGMTEPAKDIIINSYIPLSKIRERKNSLSESSQSDSFSEITGNESSKDGIALHLRPILPKKQLEIPRFSPSSAWKMLSTVENQTSSTLSGEENSFLYEEKIKKRPRHPPPPPPIIQMGSRSNNDKSGDSGISGDAGPPPYEDSPDVEDSKNSLMLPLMLSESQLTSWTPQQDLQEESSEEETNSKILFESIRLTSNDQSRRNVFSLSLPRDNRFATYIDTKDQDSHINTSLQRFKNSVAGVLNNLNKKEINENSPTLQNTNWLLSKSVPNSLNNNGFPSLEFQNVGQDETIKFSTQQNVGRVMYLPEQKNQHRSSNQQVDYDINFRKRSDPRTPQYLSKSQENISSRLATDKTQKPEEKINKSKRFTFQSTIRQIERKRLAEKLSKEAEIKEKQRLSEFEVMQRVEREFQQKRAREKANIKQKLRLFSFEEANYFSLPYDGNFSNNLSVRPDPDGAISSPASSPNINKSFSTKKYFEISAESKGNIIKSESRSNDLDDNVIKAHATEVLSEYRQMKRDYKDFRSSHYLNDINDTHFIKPTRTTIYPQITYNMPKALGYQHS